MSPLHLTVLAGDLAVWRLAADAPLPEMEPRALLSFTRTAEELSVVSASSASTLVRICSMESMAFL